jgi:hypothetical protein
MGPGAKQHTPNILNETFIATENGIGSTFFLGAKSKYMSLMV